MVSWETDSIVIHQPYTSSFTGILKSTTIISNSFKLVWTQSFAETTEFSPTVHWEVCMKKWLQFYIRYSSDIQPEKQKLAKLSWYLVYQLNAVTYPLSSYHIDIHQTWPLAFNVQHLDVQNCVPHGSYMQRFCAHRWNTLPKCVLMINHSKEDYWMVPFFIQIIIWNLWWWQNWNMWYS